METSLIVEDTTLPIPSCTLGGFHWYSQAHFLRLTEDHLLPVKPERVLLTEHARSPEKGAQVVLGLLYWPRTGIPELDSQQWQAAVAQPASADLVRASPVEIPSLLRFAFPDEVMLYVGVEDLRRRAAQCVREENRKFLDAFKDFPATTEWVRQHKGVCLWAARELLSYQKSLAASGPKE